MKKQVALLLAGIMTLSLLPVNVFAATNNFVDNRLTVPNKSALVEHGVLEKYLVPAADYGVSGGTPDYYADGTDLVVPLQRRVEAGYQFKLTLANATWFFRQVNAPDPRNLGKKLTNAIKDYSSATFAAELAKGDEYLATYELLYGDYNPIPGSDNGNYGIYYRVSSSAITTIAGVQYKEIPYTLDVSALDGSVATVTIGEAGEIYDGNYVMRIPLVTYISDSNKEATVTIDAGNNSTVTNQKIIFANTADNKTNTTIKDVVAGRDTFKLETVIINELRVGTIRPDEIIRLTLPTGYHFTRTGNFSNVKVGIESGMAWANGTTGLGENGGLFTGVRGSAPGYYYQVNFGDNVNSSGDKLLGSTNLNGVFDNDSALLIYIGDITPSTQLRGSIYIEGLEIWADEHAQIPPSGQTIEIKMTIDSHKGFGVESITTQTITIAKRGEWALDLTTITAVPTLVSGRYVGASWSGIDADDNIHKTARVRLQENAANAWWATRTTVLALPPTDNSNVKGAKFRKVKVDDTDNVTDNLKAAYTSALYNSIPGISTPASAGVYLNDGEKHGAITVNDNKITITNLTINTAKRARIDFDLWVSIEYGFGRQTGDLKLAIDPSSTSLTGIAAQNLPSVVIAHVVDPIEVTTTVSDVKIGYQYQNTNEIQIKETQAHALLAGKTVKISISDLISDDLVFTNDIKIEVISGDLKIKNILTTGQGGFTSQSQSWLDAATGNSGALSFDIERESNTASTIKISNVAVKVDRTVPLTNMYPYRAVVWGTAVAENYGLVDNVTGRTRTWKADFNTVGDMKDYIRVVSSAEDAASVLTQEVRVTVGENYYTVNGKTYTMDAESYISTASNSTMVPVRFVANALGLRDEQILWDDSTKTVTITAPNKVVQFTAGSTKMKINGTEITMQSPDLKPVSAEIKTLNGLGRMYLPFRALGEAFGIPVTWEADTRTAIYNAGAAKNSNAAVTTAGGAQPTAPTQPTPPPAQ